jgi:putative copper resistance protein D
MPEAGLIASRFLHFASVLSIFGCALFPYYTYRRGEGMPRTSRNTMRIVLVVAAAVALVAGAGWFVFTVNAIADSPNGYLDPDTVSYVLRETGFGRLWLLRLALSLLVLVLVAVRLLSARAPDRNLALTLLSALLLASLAGTGHAQSGTGPARWLQAGSDGAHLLAAGAWLGGLIPLALLGRGPRADAETAFTRFSGVGYAAVAVLVGTGLLNSWYLVGTVDALFNTPYGRLLAVKLGLFAMMLFLAALNRLRLVPALAQENRLAGTALLRLKRHVFAEQMLGLAVIFIVGILGTMSPAAGGPQ